MKEYWQMLEPDGLLLLAVPLFGFDRFLYHCTAIIPLYRQVPLVLAADLRT